MTPFETDHIIATRALDGNNFNLDSNFLRQNPLHGLAQLISQFPPETQFVVWLNHYWGAISSEGKGFEQLKVYKENKERVAAIIQILALKEETYGRDLTEMLEERLTFNEALALPSRSIMTRQRLKIIRDQIFGQLDNAVVV